MRAVFATDLSDANEAAVRSRACLECLGRYGIEEVHLVTVTSPNVYAGIPGKSLGEWGENALDAQRRIFEDAGFRVETHAVRGTPHRRINGLADRIHADLVVVGSRGESPLERRLIGSTARNMARTSTRPLLVTRITGGDDHDVAHEHLFERVLYATDFSENAERAFDQFAHLQHATTEALLLHVLGPEQRQRDEGRADAEGRLAALADDLEGRGIDVETRVVEGEPVQEILAAEQSFRPSTVLLGARGLSPMRRLLLGSVSERVTARANCNVLLVPPSRMR
ncbi:universal stress protein [Halorarius litoreus]|uniref:universal stress protein n=1 Tax=Halorarius litoreus TaxID=2962676 RepID=UPI0020CE89C6|nr:universal stress protein [Halorarius litoreus]